MQLTVSSGGLPFALRQLGAAIILGITVSASSAGVMTNITSGYKIAAAAEQHPQFFGEGPYIVEYSPSVDHDKAPEPHDLDLNAFAVAFTFEATLARSGRKIGGMSSLQAALGEFEYLARGTEEASGWIGHLLVLLPTAPIELQKLRDILVEHSIAAVFPDGSGEIHQLNMKFGRGLDKT